MISAFGASEHGPLGSWHLSSQAFYWQSAVPAPNAHSDLIRVFSARTPLACRADHWSHRRILRGSVVSSLSHDRIRQGWLGKFAQVVIPGFAFGLSHAGYLNQGFLPWLGLML